MVEKHNFNFDKLYALFSNIQLPIKKKPVIKKSVIKKPKVAIRTIRRPLRTWQKYSKIFLTKQRINKGVEFWQKYQKELTKAEKEFNIPAEIIIAILGIETNYGKQKGTHSVLKTLSNFAFNGMHRVDFYKKELEFFLLLMRQNKTDPLKPKGSYAGAMGYPQFISSSIHHYAVDFDLDSQIDLTSNPIDAIGSIANYFNKHYWEKGALIAVPVKKQKILQAIDDYKPIKPSLIASKTIDNFDISYKTKVAVINLNQEKYADWLTFWNFYVLTRYNHDNRYAMVTVKLSEAIKQQYIKQ
jgi:membrane-bound lytic murein transglycosylase B